MRDTSLRLYRVTDLVPGVSVTLRDLLEGTVVKVRERSASRSMTRQMPLAARVIAQGASGAPELESGLLPLAELGIEQVVDADLRRPVMALMSDAPLDERLAAGRHLRPPTPDRYEPLLAALAAGSSASTAAIAAYHRRELGIIAPPVRPDAGPVRSKATEDHGGVLATLLGQELVHAR